jgi:hypothetical protein
MVGAPRFELGTSCAQGRRATRLRYAPTGMHINYTRLASRNVFQQASSDRAKTVPNRLLWTIAVPEFTDISFMSPVLVARTSCPSPQCETAYASAVAGH